ncbi:MAG TPA: glycosyltransferase [Candidatus Agrococcus pullicola]|uniref:D-inositol 3-phosphate glycosyltransferase n=1 Tax=Candidatus Agrococcus pullicola TaxID=2838429 RepID=A0A9D2C9G5_9MICO|nr:glycosyltransferase [Candidatus Agrococcus pullicola]
MVSDPVFEAPLRIAFVVLHTSPIDEPGTKDAGGMNVVVRAQAEHLAATGHTVELITRRQDSEAPSVVEIAPRLRLHTLDAGPARTIDKGDHEGLIDQFRARLEDLFQRLQVDIIHGEHWFSGIAALPVARALGIPFVQSFHSIAVDESEPLDAGERAESPGRLAGEAMLARESCGLVVISEAERDTVINRLGAAPECVFIVPPGVDADLFHPEADSVRERSRQRLVVAGRLHPLKGVDLAIRALGQIPAQQRPELIVVGSPPPDGTEYAESLVALCRELAVEADVRFVGAKTRVPLAEELRSADIVLMPSHSETFGLVSLEAAASGVPVIAYRSGGLRESVLDGRTGILVDTRDPAAWGRAILQLLNDEALRSRLAVQAREHAERMSWETSTVALLEVYRKKLDDQREQS